MKQIELKVNDVKAIVSLYVDGEDTKLEIEDAKNPLTSGKWKSFVQKDHKYAAVHIMENPSAIDREMKVTLFIRKYNDGFNYHGYAVKLASMISKATERGVSKEKKETIKRMYGFNCSMIADRIESELLEQYAFPERVY